MSFSVILPLGIVAEDFVSAKYTFLSQPCFNFICFSQLSNSSLSDVSVSAVIDTVKCANDVSFPFEFAGENVELDGLGVELDMKSIRFLSSKTETVSIVLVSQNEDDRAGDSIINDEVGELAGREEEETSFGDSKDPDAEDVPPDDLLLDVAVAGKVLWNAEVDENFASNEEFADILDW